MLITRTIPPAMWTQLLGVWVHITATADPLLRAELHRVDVHRDPDGHVWVVVGGENAGVRVQSSPPDEYDTGSVR